MKTVTFYSYKGGTGRTLALANVAKYLTFFGHKVVMMDLDLEAPGLAYKLGNGDAPVPVEWGIVDFLYERLIARETFSLDRYVTPLGQFHFIGAGNIRNPDYWRRLQEIHEGGWLRSPESEGSLQLIELKRELEEILNPDFLLIDSRTGITELGGLATITLADILVCLMVANRESQEGARAILRSVGAGSGDRKLIAVLSRIEATPPSGLLSLFQRTPDRVELADRLIKYLEEPRDGGATGLNVDNLLTLQTDLNLQEIERLYIDEGGQWLHAPLGTLTDDYRDLSLLIAPLTAPELANRYFEEDEFLRAIRVGVMLPEPPLAMLWASLVQLELLDQSPNRLPASWGLAAAEIGPIFRAWEQCSGGALQRLEVGLKLAAAYQRFELPGASKILRTLAEEAGADDSKARCLLIWEYGCPIEDESATDHAWLELEQYLVHLSAKSPVAVWKYFASTQCATQIAAILKRSNVIAQQLAGMPPEAVTFLGALLLDLRARQLPRQ